MDPTVANRLASDDTFRKDIKKLADNYIQLGSQGVEYFVSDLDAAHDALMCYAPVTSDDFKKMEAGAPRSYVLPMTATQVTTLTTFLSQILFGTNANRRVDPREDKDEEAAELMNQLLRWNDDQQPSYLTGYLFIQDAITFNRGVMYEYWQDIYEVNVVPQDVEDTSAPKQPKLDSDGQPVLDELGEPIVEHPKYQRWKKERKKVGGYTKACLVSPYDFICDPAMPLSRMQEGRFAGHRVMIPWHELDRRSKLPKSDYAYVDPTAVERLKKGKPDKSPAIPGSGGNATENRSRSYYERQRRNGIATGNGGTTANKEDGGIVECWSLQLRAIPKELKMYDDDEQHEIIEVLIGGQEILSVNVMPNKHDEYTYAAAEARPYAHYQFSPSWASMIRPIQDQADYLKDKHQDALARTVGNIFIGRADYVDFDAFTDPKKEGLIIPIKPDAPNVPIDQIVKQVPINDITKDFSVEIQALVNMAENTTGAHAFMQGEDGTDTETATEFSAIQQMSSGRVSAVARLIWSQGVGPQTKRMVANFQQFLTDELVIRVSGDSWDDLEAKFQGEKYVSINREAIQGNFDLVVHDGSLPTTDAKKVAASTRLIESVTGNEVLMQYFDPKVPGNIDLKKLFMATLKATGIPVGNYQISEEQAKKNALQMSQSSLPPGVQPAGGAPVPTGPAGMPSAGALPPIPPATPAPPAP